MSREKVSSTKARAIIRMHELGFAVAKISSLLNVSRVTVYDHINPNGYRARLRRVNTSNRGQHLTVRECPKKCELCKAESKKLYFHVLTKKRLSAGLWLCNSCNVFCDICDNIGTPGLLKRAITYFDLVDSMVPEENQEYISKMSKQNE